MGKHPGHTASIEYLENQYVVKVGDSVIVETKDAIVLKESAMSPVLYFPIKDTKKEFLKPTDQHTFCPLKGKASYYSLAVDGNILENAVWYYPKPLNDVKEIAGYLAFYADKVEIVKVD